MTEIHGRVFKMNIQGASLKADSGAALLATTAEAKTLMKEVEDLQAVAKKAAKNHQAWLTLNKV
eukprot:10513217-Heterocapsa_arctica.AAC.1